VITVIPEAPIKFSALMYRQLLRQGRETESIKHRRYFSSSEEMLESQRVQAFLIAFTGWTTEGSEFESR
jgi:hypothetical protein